MAWVPVVGSDNKLPSGWVTCGSTNTTPNLDQRFLMGVSSFDQVGNVGGRPDIHQDGQHAHGGVTSGTQGYGPGKINYPRGPGRQDDYAMRLTITPDGNHHHGGENRPPFYTVIYICKT
jgi:hypothetical protein